MFSKKTINRFIPEPGKRVHLKDYPTDWKGGEAADGLADNEIKEHAGKLLEKSRRELDDAQELLYASDAKSLLLIFQAIDAAGKDGTIRHVMSGVNPQGCQVYSFKKPSVEEMDHNFLWRYMKALPERGRIGIFNRSYYEDVLVVKVHPGWINETQLGKPDDKFWEKRYEDINNFEKHLVRNGTVVLKFFLNLSKEEQRKRFLARIDDPRKQWKFSEADVEERQYWDDYQHAFEDALSATSTKKAPWHIIPADHKYIARALVADIIVSAIKGMDLKYPEVSLEQKAGLATSRQKLMDEG